MTYCWWHLELYLVKYSLDIIHSCLPHKRAECSCFFLEPLFWKYPALLISLFSFLSCGRLTFGQNMQNPTNQSDGFEIQTIKLGEQGFSNVITCMTWVFSNSLLKRKRLKENVLIFLWLNFVVKHINFRESPARKPFRRKAYQ